MGDLSGKKVAMIIASKNFRDEEFNEPYNLLGQKGAEVTVASSSLGTRKGMLGGTAKATVLVRDVKAADYDAVIFVGGSGSSEYFSDPVAHQIAKDAAAGGKVLCAICIAPSTLANAGLLKGKRATCYPSEKGNLTAKGAQVTATPVVRDGRIITAEGPGAAVEFAKAIAEALS